ncbi:MAG: DUF2283 domain-containing protein [Cyanobacteria bacterium P01_A01_bin.15]
MADGRLIFRYDQEGDILYIDQCAPYAEQESEEIGDEIVARLNPESGAVENVEILFFSKRLAANEQLELPIEMDLRLAS